MSWIESIIKDFADLKLSDNFMFSAVMQDIDNCKNFLELVLNIHIVRITRNETEKTMKFTPDSKGIRLDVYVEDEDSAYDIEMQTSAEHLPKRSRYYQGMMDRGLLKAGQHYKDLRKGIVIFVCTFDPFGYNLPVYTFENLCREDNNIKLNDDTLKIFLNTNGDRNGLSTSMCNLYDLINDGKAKDDFTNKLISDINIIKNNDIWRERYMEWNATLMDVEYLAEKRGEIRGEKRGEIRGEKRGEKRGLVKAFLMIGYDYCKISEALNMPLEEVEKIAGELEMVEG